MSEEYLNKLREPIKFKEPPKKLTNLYGMLEQLKEEDIEDVCVVVDSNDFRKGKIEIRYNMKFINE